MFVKCVESLWGASRPKSRRFLWLKKKHLTLSQSVHSSACELSSPFNESMRITFSWCFDCAIRRSFLWTRQWDCRLWNWFGRPQIHRRISLRFVEGSGGSRPSTPNSEQQIQFATLFIRLRLFCGAARMAIFARSERVNVRRLGTGRRLLANANFNLIIPLALLCFLVHISRRSTEKDTARWILMRIAKHCAGTRAPPTHYVCVCVYNLALTRRAGPRSEQKKLALNYERAHA
jgi:hypothetical protein